MFKRIKAFYNSQVKRNQKQLIGMINGRINCFRNYTISNHKKEVLAGIKEKTPENPALYGYKVYSQNDEDGIIAYIFNKIGGNKTFIELGCGMGLENNTHWLLLNGWKGIWVDGAENNVKYITQKLNGYIFPDHLWIDHQFITLKNVDDLFKKYVQFLKVKQPDFVSIDIDGNDFYIIERLLETGLKPKAFCIEYNSKFPPPSLIKIAYNEDHIWAYDDYQSASLQCWVNLMKSHGYTLICCNTSGLNGFFVEDFYLQKFTEYSIEDLFQPARFHFSEEISGHVSTLNYLRDLLKAKHFL